MNDLCTDDVIVYFSARSFDVDVLHTRDSQLRLLLTYIREPSWPGIERHNDVTDAGLAAMDVDDIIRVLDRQRRQREIERNCTSPLPWKRVENAPGDHLHADGHRRRLRHISAPSDVTNQRLRNRALDDGGDGRGTTVDTGLVAGVASSGGGEARSIGLLSAADCENESTWVVAVERVGEESGVQQRIDRYHQVAHALHYASIVILGLLVIEVS